MNANPFLLFLMANLIGSGLNSANARMVTNSSEAMEYMEKYGYMNKTSMDSMKKMPEGEMMKMMKDNVMMFQMFAGVNQTGELDEKTMEMMNVPRCGNKENMNMMRNQDMPRRERGYKTTIPWEFTDLTYRIENVPPTGLSLETVRKEMRKAFDLWEAVAQVTFREVFKTDQVEVDIQISFVTGPHEDNMPFSRGEIGTPVAHAFYPHPGDPDLYHFQGDIHFDSTRGWTINAEDGINFFQIATHEIGHALGLEHSAATHAVMHAMPQTTYDPKFQLHRDDIEGIKNLYGARFRRKPQPQPQPGGWNSNEVDPETSGSSHYPVTQVPPPFVMQPRLNARPEVHPPSPPVEPPSLVLTYYFQPLKYLWHCHQLAREPFHRPASLYCYEQVTQFLIKQKQAFIHQQQIIPSHIN